MITALEREKATIKARYKQKRIESVARIRSEVALELQIVEEKLRMTEALLIERESSLSLVTQRVEELEMMASNNSLEVKEVQRRYKVMISQLKTDNEELQKKYLARIDELKLLYEQ